MKIRMEINQVTAGRMASLTSLDGWMGGARG